MKTSWLVLLSLHLACLCLAGDVIVVTSTEEDGVSEPKVLEIYDFVTKSWRAVEKSEQAVPPGPSYRAESLRPGTARLVENHAVLQYELRNGLSMELASYPQTIEGSATLEYGDTFCLVGGYNTADRTLRSTVLCWNPLTPRKTNGTENASGGWVALPNMLVGRHQPGAVVMDGKLYVAGGYDTEHHRFLNSVEVFDDVSQKWYMVTGMKFPRAGLSLVSEGGRLYAMGGYRDYKYLDVVEEYDPLHDEWTTLSKMKLPRAKFGAVKRDGQIYVVGGRKGFRRGDQLGSVEVFSPQRNEWNELEASMSIIRGPVRATLVKDK